MILAGHLGEIIAQILAVLETNRPRYRGPEQAKTVGHRRVGRYAGRDIHVSCQRGPTFFSRVSEYPGEAVQERETKGRLVAVMNGKRNIMLCVSLFENRPKKKNNEREKERERERRETSHLFVTVSSGLGRLLCRSLASSSSSVMSVSSF